MATLSQFKMNFDRLDGRTTSTITLSIYSGTNPNSLGSLLWSDTLSSAELSIAGGWQEKTFSPAIDVSSFTLVISPTEIAESGILFFNDIVSQAGTLPYNDNFSSYLDTAPYGSFAVNPNNTIPYVEFTIGGATVKSDTANVGSYSPLTGYSGSNTKSYRHAVVYAPVPSKATTPFPVDAATGVVNNDSDLTLTWEDGGGATSYDVYFGTLSLTKVAEGITDLEYNVGALNSLTGYQWRIDSINDAGTTEGDTWTFTTSGTYGLGKAIIPTPDNEATDISPTVESVAWQNGGGASSYDIYFGAAADSLTKIETVDASAADIFTAETFSAGKFSIGGSATFYWRVDAKNYFGTVEGDTWEFTTTALNAPDFTSASGSGIVASVRRLVVAAKNTIFYEDV